MTTMDLGYRKVNRSAYAHSTGQTTDIYLGTCEMHDRGVRHEGHADPVSGQLGKYRIWCPVPEAGASGHWIVAERLVAVTTTVTCDGSCMGARGPHCDCGCGGANHGRAWGVTATREEFESALARYAAEKARVEAKRTQRHEARERKAAAEQASWAAEHAGLLAALEAHRPDELGYPREGSNGFLCDIARQALVHGRALTEGQVAAAERVLAQLAARAAQAAERKANAKPCPTGKVQISGTIVKVKASEGYMGGTLRLQATVACDGYAVLITLPRDVESWVMRDRMHILWPDSDMRWAPSYGGTDYEYCGQRWTAACKGVTISCTVTVEQSRRDPSFGFGKRPTKVSFTPPVPAGE